MNFGRRFLSIPAAILLALAAIFGMTAKSDAFDFLSKKGIAEKEVTPSLVADTTAIVAGKPFTVGVRLQMQPGWHIYWQFPGGPGGPPTIEWELPPGFQAGPIQWPIPESKTTAGYTNNVYEGEVVLPVEITPPAQLPANGVTLKAHLKWLVCADTCVQEQGDVEVKLPTSGDAAPANVELFAKWRAQLPKDSGAPFKTSWDLSQAKQFSVHIDGAPTDAKVEFFPLPMDGVTPGAAKVGEPASKGSETFIVPVTNITWHGVLVIGKPDGTREGWNISSEEAQPADSSAVEGAVPTQTAAATGYSAPPAAPVSAGGLIPKLLIAFLGGLIMNVMPCVLPVIALKIFGFVSQAGEAPGRVFKLGLAFNAGVFTFFLGLAAAVARLKTAFNFGYQFQNPYILAALIALIFVFGLSLLGVFELTLTSGTASKLSELSGREGYGGAFLHGMFTTLLGTSCTAPFLGTSLGFAVTQSTPVIFLLFIAIAAGMSFPYFLLTARPAWMRYLPKPGLWMERMKQIMGFAMLAVAVWLFGVLGLRGQEVSAGMGWFLLTLGLAAWIFGLMHGPMLLRLSVILLPIAGYWFFLQGALSPSTKAGIAWQPYSDERLASARAKGEPVFIDFTAAWCINCHVYEDTVLNTDAIRAKFREKQIVALKADWTNTENPVVTRALKSYGAVGVPLYVLYRPGESEPVLSQGITTGQLLSDLNQIKQGAVAAAH